MTEEKNNDELALDQTFDLMEALRVLDPSHLEVEQTLAEGLTVRHPDIGQHAGISVEPCFPVTHQDSFLILRDSDGNELGILETLNGMPHASRDALTAELAKQHFIPIITRIDAIYREFQIPVWEVQTDRGPRRLELKSSHDAHRLPGGRVYVRDSEGNGYLIPDYRRMDPVSRELIELYA